MISEGNGTHADSMAISRVMPRYPEAEMTVMMKWARTASIFSVIRRQYRAVSQSLCRHKGREVWFSLGENHENI